MFIFSILPPHLEWAQRKDRVWITVILENCKDEKHELKGNTFSFSGTGGTENVLHEVTLELFGEIDPEKSMLRKNDRLILFTIMKKESSASYWPRLTKEEKKLHFLKTDFNRWKDEDDTDDDDREDFNLDEMMNSMGGLNGADLGGGAAEEQEDSDDEELPDLQ